MRSLLAALLAAMAIVGAGCSSLGNEDETVGWSAQRLYGEAKDAMVSRDWQKAIKLLEFGSDKTQGTVLLKLLEYRYGKPVQPIEGVPGGIPIGHTIRFGDGRNAA